MSGRLHPGKRGNMLKSNEKWQSHLAGADSPSHTTERKVRATFNFLRSSIHMFRHVEPQGAQELDPETAEKVEEKAKKV